MKKQNCSKTLIRWPFLYFTLWWGVCTVSVRVYMYYHVQRTSLPLWPWTYKEYRLPSDPNYKRFVFEYGDNVVELDSLPPGFLRDIVEHCITTHIDQELLVQVKEMETKERGRLQELVEQLQI